MVLLRLVLFLSALAIVLCGGLYFFTRQHRYLAWAWQIVRFDLVLLGVFGMLWLLERYVLVGWRVFI